MRHIFKNLLTAVLIITAIVYGVSPLYAQSKVKVPKNVIVLIGDGMSYNTVTATNYYVNGADNTVSYQKFPIQLGVSTFNAQNGNADDPNSFKLEYRSDSAWLDFKWVARNGGYTDSAPAATALSTGKKTFDGSICMDMNREKLSTILEYSKSIGKGTGVVTSVQFAHATPAGYVAHNLSRNNYAEIANEMLNSDIDVIIGAGHPEYNDNAQPRENKEYKFVGGEETWNKLKSNTLSNWTFTDDSTTISNIAKGNNIPARLVAIPRVATTFQQVRTVVNAQVPYADKLNRGIPTLVESSKAALNVLSKKDNGFFLMIEGGAIDWANHANQKGRMIEEQIDFNNTVDAVIAWVEANGGWDNNLIIVTSDHECGYLLGEKDNDNNPNTNPVKNNGKGNVPGIKYNSGNHTNMLVPIYAKGAGAEIFEMFADREDPIVGRYIDNTEIAQSLFSLWQDATSTKQIKNLIYMISDGWGENQILAANYYSGSTQAFESFPTSLYMSTFHGKGSPDSKEIDNYFTSYNSGKAWSDKGYVKIKPTDSAPAATAMGSGEKTFDGSINKDYDLASVKTLSEIAMEKGKSAGVVSSVQLSHATPAAFGAAHNLSRNNYAEIANEMFTSKMSVIIGAGHPEYDDNGQPRAEKEYKFVGGEATWNALKSNTLSNWYFTDSKARIEEIANGNNIPTRLVAIPQVATTFQQARNTSDPQNVELNKYNSNIPSLTDASKAAIKVLSQNDNGFFVMIEGGAIDWACHANQKGRVIEEQIDFNHAVNAMIEWVEQNSNWDETLLIVTGDHECGYLAGNTEYAPIIDNGEGNIPSMTFYSGDHTNQLIPFYAKGIGADILNRMAGNYDMKRGYYADNTDAAVLTKQFWNKLDNASNSIKDNSSANNSDNQTLKCNVTNNVLTVFTEEIKGSVTLQVINVNGQVILSQPFDLNGENIKTELPQNTKGIIFIRLTQDNNTKVGKYIVR